MSELCKVGKTSSCNGKVQTKPVTFRQPTKTKANEIKEKVIKKLLKDAVRCYKSKKCDVPLIITAISIGGCDVCVEHVPEVRYLLDRIAETDLGRVIPIQLTEVNYNRGGKAMFDEFECEGTPCFILNNDEKLYEGRRGLVGSLSSILGVKNPLYK